MGLDERLWSGQRQVNLEWEGVEGLLIGSIIPVGLVKAVSRWINNS